MPEFDEKTGFITFDHQNGKKSFRIRNRNRWFERLGGPAYVIHPRRYAREEEKLMYEAMVGLLSNMNVTIEKENPLLAVQSEKEK